MVRVKIAFGVWLFSSLGSWVGVALGRIMVTVNVTSNPYTKPSTEKGALGTGEGPKSIRTVIKCIDPDTLLPGVGSKLTSRHYEQLYTVISSNVVCMPYIPAE